MMSDLIVVDDFYTDPVGVRDKAMSVEYSDVRSLNYPGYQSTASYTSDAVKRRFRDLLGHDLEIDEGKLTFGRFRVMLEGSHSRLKVHVDGEADWTGIIYLNPKEQCRGGTAFYRHRRTGLSGPPSTDQAALLGFPSASNWESAVVEPDSICDAAWEQTMFVSMRFNRLVLFRGGKLFHSHTCSWGEGIHDGRLTQNFFFNSVATNCGAR